MISETPNQYHSLKTTSDIIPSRFLKPTIFLSSKQNTTKPIFHNIKTPDQNNYFKKYFGHKVLYVKRSTQFISIIHSRRLLQKISFDKGICQKDGFKCSFDAIILGDNIKTPKRFSKRVLKGFRGKLSLAFKEEEKNIASYLKNNLTHLHGLEITLQKIEQFGFNRRAFDRNSPPVESFLRRTIEKLRSKDPAPVRVKSLQSFSLKLDPKFEKECGWDSKIKTLDFHHVSDQQNPLSFLLLLLQKTHLKKLKLNLAPYPLSALALSYLLLSIEQAKIPEWYVRSGMIPAALTEFVLGKDVKNNRKFPLHLTNSSEVIQKIDFFGLYVINFILESRDNEWHSDECGSKEFSPQILSKILQLTSKSRKVLDITLTERLTSPDLILTTLLKKFSSLEGLYIKAPENTLKFDKDSDQPEEKKSKEFPWMKSLKQALLSIVNAEYEGHRSYRSDKPLEDLVKHLRDGCATLESLNVFSASTVYRCVHRETSRTGNEVKVPCESLTGLSALQELEINSDDRYLRGMTKTLESLKKLRKLRLNFCDTARSFTLGERDRWNNKENIFDGLGKLKEFELFVRPDQWRNDGTSTPLYWMGYLTKNIHKLQNLEVLRVFDSKEIQIEMEVFLRLLTALSKFTSLREIVIHSKITISVDVLELAADLSGETLDKTEDRVIDLLESKLSSIIDLNPNLKLVDIRSFKDTKLDFIFYKAK